MNPAGIESFDLTRVHPGAKGYSGVVNDGRYLYLVPLNNGQFNGPVLRYDPTGRFDDPAAWSSFESARVHPEARGFVNGLFDGRHLYLVPYFNGRHHGHVTRYDTQAEFADPASWQVFDTMTLDPHCRGFVSGVWDGRYIYLAPYQLDWSVTHGRITRYDPQGAFDDPAAWSVFDIERVIPLARGFHSAIATDSHVYFVPYLTGGKDYSGLLVRHERALPFTDPAAWQSFDLVQLDPGCRGYIGGTVQDGWLYLSPYMDGQDRHGRVLRFDTRQQLDDHAAWTLFDCATVDPGSRGFFGCQCDDRHLYLVPHCRGVGQYHGQLTRCTLEQGFSNPQAWSICDLARVDPALKGFIGGVILDGCLYLPPFETDAGQHSGLMARVRLDAEAIWTSGEVQV